MIIPPAAAAQGRAETSLIGRQRHHRQRRLFVSVPDAIKLAINLASLWRLGRGGRRVSNFLADSATTCPLTSHVYAGQAAYTCLFFCQWDRVLQLRLQLQLAVATICHVLLLVPFRRCRRTCANFLCLPACLPDCPLGKLYNTGRRA